MDWTAFEGLEVLRREYADDAGDAELCRRRDGEKLVRLRVRRGECQRACLRGALPGHIRLERGILELLYPWEEGASLEEWLFTRTPALGERRDACLALVSQCLTEGVSPCVLTLSAKAENLRISNGGARLVYLADWGNWQGEATAAQSVQAVAELCGAILTRALPRGSAVPVELELLLRRLAPGGYVRWETLHRDLSALPDAMLSGKERGEKLLRDMGRRAARLCKPVFCLATGAALVLALLSLASEAIRRQSERAVLWPGMTAVAGESWGEEP